MIIPLEQSNESIAKEEICFHKVFGEGKSIKILHDAAEEKKFACAAEDKKDLFKKYNEVWKCMDPSKEEKRAYWKNMTVSMLYIGL